MKLLDLLSFFLVFSFLFFGMSCLFAPRMKREFERYGLQDQRRLTGVLQLAGSAGLLAGLMYSPLLALFALAGLTLLMLLGVGVRLKISDPWPALLPALFYATACAYLFFSLLEETQAGGA
ncbi:DoxX-like family protein [Muriicola jejuensis]|uniref:DoxX family protein n=1 Tax=Muriicola jejuensis TaxID=504488 RepID=A0A6P0UF98_9FLAO|nr:DoxX family protein [Muriicola jejuensis]NER11292.1 hypothetical protein [Muriicola jejuensis]SMP21768.1 DoxX-like family protein [Muriicola jejuensis]